MKRALLILLAAASVASAQTFITVTADTNRVIRTNFSLVRSQVSDLSGASFAISNITGLQTALDGKLATNGTLAISNITSLQASLDEKLSTNGSAGGLTNFPAMLLQTNSTDGSFPSFLLRTNGSASALTNFPASVLLTNSSESVFPAALLRTNSSLSAFPQGLLRTNGDGSGLTNLPNANLSNAVGVLPIANGGTGSTNQSSARTALGLGSAATNDASAFQPASTALTNLAAGDASGLTNLPNANLGTATGVLGIANGGSGATNAETARTNFGLVWSGLTNTDAAGFRTALSLGTAATNDATAFQPASTNLDALANNNGGSLTNVSVDLTAVLPSYSNNAGKVLAVASGETNVEWTAISNTVTDASTLTNFPASILQTNSAETNFPAFLLRTNGSAAGLSGLSFALSNASDVSISNIASPIIRAWLNDTNSFDTLQIPGNTTTNQNNQRTTTIGIGAVSRSPLGTAVGFEADSGLGSYNVAIGAGAVIGDAANAVQIGVGTNTNTTTAQILSWGSVDSTEWGALANSTGIGREIMQAPTNGTNGQVLIWTNNDVAWATGGGGGSGTVTSVAMTVPAFLSVSGSPITNSGTLAVSYSGTALPVANGGTGTTSAGNQLQVNLGLTSLTQFWTELGANANASGNSAVALGYNTDATTTAATAIGENAQATGLYSLAVGSAAYATNREAIALGRDAWATATNAVQIGDGTNSTTSTIQFLSGGTVDATEWGALANSTAIGREIMQAPTNGTNGQVLVWTNNDVAWATSSGGLPEVPLAISNGGTGSTNTDRNTMQVNLGLTTTNSGRVQIGYNSSADSNTVTVGVSAAASSTGAVAVGHTATAVTTGSVALGYQSDVNTGSLHGIAIGYGANIENVATNSIAIGRSAFGRANSAVQIGTGSNSTASTIQFLTAGTVDATEWGYLANASTQGGYAMTNTAGISGSKTFVAYDGTNYTTNTVTFSNGIITGWTP